MKHSRKIRAEEHSATHFNFHQTQMSVGLALLPPECRGRESVSILRRTMPERVTSGSQTAATVGSGRFGVSCFLLGTRLMTPLLVDFRRHGGRFSCSGNRVAEPHEKNTVGVSFHETRESFFGRLNSTVLEASA